MTKEQDIVKTVEKEHGKGALLTLGDPSRPFPALSSGIAGLDAALGGGWTRGGVAELYGSAQADAAIDRVLMRTIVTTMRNGSAAAYVDTENRFDVCEASREGVDVGRLLVSQPDNGEQALAIVESLARSGAVELVVMDGVRSLMPLAVLAGDVGDEERHMGTAARMFSQGVRRIAACAGGSHCLVLFVNRLPSRGEVGSSAIKFYAQQRVDVRVSEGRHVANVCKNKLAAPFKRAPIYPTAEELGLVEGADVQVCLTSVEASLGPAAPSEPRYWFPGYRIVSVDGDRVKLQPEKPNALTISVPLRLVRVGGQALEVAWNQS